MGIKIKIENFEILKSYSDIYNNKACGDDDRYNFTKCPIGVYLNLGRKYPILLLDLYSNTIETKIDYSNIITREDIIENEKYEKISIYTIYFISYINNDLGGDVRTSYTFDILTTGINYGIFSQKCYGCMGMRGIVRYWGFIKYAEFLNRFHIMDIDFDPFRMLVIKINLIDIRPSSKDNRIIIEEITPQYLFNTPDSHEFFGSITNFCYAWRYPSSIGLPKFMKIFNYNVHISCREDEYYKLVIYFVKKNNEVSIRSALYDKEFHYFKYYAAKTHPINFRNPFMSITDSSNRTKDSRIIFNYEIM
ncbi:hypothetical protein RF11_11479 [Thelohanellus kitauei]|uniref:Uncharacterized protein n=1 Tax=Thelohanellus kitauei TaxID=669202 RepID=A0A0C2NCI8_THEKT|nr:hypothetical protein RF11_11479 [Thelohanellus kitauei]